MDEITLSTRIVDLDITVRAKTCLANINVRTVAELLPLKERDLRKVPQLGKKTIREIGTIKKAIALSSDSNNYSDTSPASSNNPLLTKYLDELNLSERAKNCMRNAKILTIGDLLITPAFRLKKIKNLGKKTLEELLQLKTEFKEYTPQKEPTDSEPVIHTYRTIIEHLKLSCEELLEPRDAEIFKQRNGLDDGHFLTLEEIGDIHGISRERVRQILNKSVKKIRGLGIRRSHLSSSEAATLISFLNSSLLETQNQDSQYSAKKIIDLLNEELSYLPTRQAFKLLEGLLQFELGHTVHRQISIELNTLRDLEKQQRRQEKNTRRRAKRFYNLIAASYWPQTVRKRTVEETAEFKPIRTVAKTKISGQFYSNKMLRYVEYESRLEYRFFLKLEKNEEVILYIEQPLSVEYYFNGKNSRYFPDALLLLQDGRVLIVEIKPKVFMNAPKNIAKWKSLKQFCIQHGYGLLVTHGVKDMSYEKLDEL